MRGLLHRLHARLAARWARPDAGWYSGRLRFAGDLGAMLARRAAGTRMRQVALRWCATYAARCPPLGTPCGASDAVGP
jgi:hypothetical protein